ncbi:MAG TPA: peptide chain release factor 1 [Actinomycetota bacterium]|nr:peptide chain release factor 1 [Actinomycetota bacterium]
MRERLDDLERRYLEIEEEMSSPEVAADPDRLRALGKAYAELREIVVPYRELREAERQAEEARELARGERDPEMRAFLQEEAERAASTAGRLQDRLQELLVPRDPNDERDVVVEVRAGAGGQEAALWAAELAGMYRRFAERHGWGVDVLSSSPSDLGGFKEIALEVRGRGAYSRFKHESGVHRVQRVPVTESGGRIHTSTATVAVLPEADEVEVEIRPEDLEIDVFRSSGPGGQSVNTTDSAVRITHRPTGIVVTCQEERSQQQNREKAMRYLRSRLLQRARDEAQRREAEARRSQVGTGERAEKIRTYNFPENRVTDHRVKLTVHRLPEVLDGALDELVDALLASERRQQLAEDPPPTPR